MKQIRLTVYGLTLFFLLANSMTAVAITGDVNGDDKIDLKEVIYALQIVAGMHVPGTGGYIVFAWNDLGMHCLNPTYDSAVILPPYNTVWS
jgi:hypothetical protein